MEFVFTFNRTSLELKPCRYCCARENEFPFNRTSLELKLDGQITLSGREVRLLIEPVWN